MYKTKVVLSVCQVTCHLLSVHCDLLFRNKDLLNKKLFFAILQLLTYIECFFLFEEKILLRYQDIQIFQIYSRYFCVFDKSAKLRVNQTENFVELHVSQIKKKIHTYIIQNCDVITDMTTFQKLHFRLFLQSPTQYQNEIWSGIIPTYDKHI